MSDTKTLADGKPAAAHHAHTAISTAGLLIALGIIYGDIGTSPLYVMKAIVPGVITQDLVYGGISAVLWTLTLQTTIKYVLLTLNADKANVFDFESQKSLMCGVHNEAEVR